VTVIQAAEIKYLKYLKDCAKTDRIINEDIKTELGMFTSSKEYRRKQR
jgi:hypothetical protein